MDKQIISHIGIAVYDLEKAVHVYKIITGDNEPELCDVTDQKVKVAVFKSGNLPGGKIELLSPTSDDSPIAKFLSKRGEGLHHICVYVDDIVKRLEELKNSGLDLIDQLPRKGAEGNLIAFIHPKSTSGVLIELEQKIIE